MQASLPKFPQWVYVVLAIIVSGGALTVALVDGDGDGRPDRIDVTVNTPATAPFDGRDIDLRPDDGVVVAPVGDETLEEIADRVEEGKNRRDPDGGAPAVQPAIERNRATTEALPTAGAVQGFPGCRTRILPSSDWAFGRGGVRPVWLSWHYAVIRNRPGWSDLDILFNVFAGPATASSNFGIDAEGHCTYMVPIEHKAYTAVNANPFSISVEIIAWGDERELCPGPCMRTARRIAREVRRRTGIPIRLGAVNPSNPCAPGSAGQMTHWKHGGCGGAHHDVQPFSIDTLTRQLAAPASRLTAHERNIVRERCSRRAQVTAAPKGGTARRGALGASRIARQVVRNQMRRLTAARRSSGRPWGYRHRGARRHELARIWTGSACG